MYIVSKGLRLKTEYNNLLKSITIILESFSHRSAIKTVKFNNHLTSLHVYNNLPLINNLAVHMYSVEIRHHTCTKNELKLRLKHLKTVGFF